MLERAAMAVLLLVAAGCTASQSDGGRTDDDGTPGPDGDEDSEGRGPDEPGGPNSYVPPGRRVTRRLTATQYRNSVEQALGMRLPQELVLPIDRQVGRYANGDDQASPSVAIAKVYAEAAALIAARVFDERGSVADGLRQGCGDDAGCLSGFVDRTGRRLFRRALDKEERAALVDAATAAEAKLEDRARYALEVLLQSPSFLFVLDRGEPASEHPGTLRRDAYSFAARLALLLWNSGPDDDLLEAATRNELSTNGQIAAQVARLLADERARSSQMTFLREWLGYDLAPSKTKGDAHPSFTREVAEALVKEADDTIGALVSMGRPATELFTLARSRGDEVVRSFYGAEARDGAGTFALPEARRSVLGLGAFIAANSGSAKPSPTLRGLAVLERFLCAHVGSPPADAPPELPNDVDAGPMTVRERTERFMLAPGTTCNGCQRLMDPTGFLFEHFDVTRRHRTHEPLADAPGGGKPVNAKGRVYAVSDEELEGVSELGTLLAGSPQARQCLARQFVAWSLGRDDEDDEPLAQVIAAAEGAKPSVAGLFEALALNESFRFVRPE